MKTNKNKLNDTVKGRMDGKAFEGVILNMSEDGCLVFTTDGEELVAPWSCIYSSNFPQQ